MALFRSNRPRPTRAIEFRRTSAPADVLRQLFGNRHGLLRVGIGLLTVIVLTVVVEGWKSPFTFRLGQVYENGVTSRIDFEVADDFATEQKRNDRENAVEYEFHHDPSPVRNLSARLRNALEHIAMSTSLEDVPLETRAAFGLVSASAQQPDGADAAGAYETLRTAVAGMGAGNDLRVEEILAEFEEFVEPLRQTGVANSAELQDEGIGENSTLAVVSSDGSRQIVTPSQVLLSSMVEDTGALGRNWEFAQKLKPIRPQLERWLVSQVPITLRYDAEATRAARKAARESVAPVTESFQRGEVLVVPGAPIDVETIRVLRQEHQASQAASPFWRSAVRALIVAGLLFVLAALNGYYIAHNEPGILRDVLRLSGFVATVVLAIAVGRALSVDPWRAEVIALSAAVMVLAIAYNQVLAAITAFSLVLVVSLSTVVRFEQFVVLMAVCATAVIGLSRVSSRTTIIKVGFMMAVVHLLVSAGTTLLQTSLPYDVQLGRLVEALRGAGWCILAGYLVAGSLPFIESAFGVVTDISLLEMSDLSHPLLQELVQRAPGTYNHSMTVATIGETAADRIGANGLLVRVGAYFHDIGKMLKPEYFIENTMAGQGNRHDALAPAMSTLIIIGHVKDGVELARQHNLPQRLVDFIEQHHGTTLVEYFYREAAKRAQDADHKTDAEEASFRYPGPRPQSRETAVMMLADCVESASRTIDEPTPKRLESLVHDLTMKRLLDGQFDESPLTLNEIRIIQESLTKSLIGIYHGRIKYHEQRSA